MAVNRKEYAKRNIVWGVIYRIVSVLGPFVIRSLFISRLGAEYLGLNGLFTSVLQILSLAELGFSSAIVFSMYKPAADGNVQLVREYLAYFKKIYRFIGLIVLVVGVALIPFLDYFVKGDIPENVDIRLAFIIYLINTAASYLTFAYKQSVLSAYQRNDFISKASMLTVCMQYALQLLVLVLTPNYYLFIIILPLTTVLNNCFLSIITDRVFPEYRSGLLNGLTLEPSRRAEIRKHVGGLMINRICSTTRDSFDSIVISTFLGLTAVAQYSNYFCVISSLFSVLTTINSAVGNSIGNSVATETPSKNYHDLRLFTFMYAMVACVCASCLSVLYQPFIKLWVGSDMLLPYGMMVLFCMYFYVRSIGDIRSLYENATGIWWQMRWRMISEAALNVILNLALVNFFGIYGIVLATIISLLCVNFLYGARLVFQLYFKNGKTTEHYLDHLLYAFVTFVSCFICCIIVGHVSDGNFILLLLKAVLTVCVSLAIECLFFFRTNRFRLMIDFIKGFFHVRTANE